MLLAPVPQLPATVTRDPATKRVSIVLGVVPSVRPHQEARLSVGVSTALAARRSRLRRTRWTFDFGPIAPGPDNGCG